MKIDISNNIKVLKAIEAQFNKSQEPDNIFKCLCAIEVQAASLQQLVDNFKDQYSGYMVARCLKEQGIG